MHSQYKSSDRKDNRLKRMMGSSSRYSRFFVKMDSSSCFLLMLSLSLSSLGSCGRTNDPTQSISSRQVASFAGVSVEGSGQNADVAKHQTPQRLRGKLTNPIRRSKATHLGEINLTSATSQIQTRDDVITGDLIGALIEGGRGQSGEQLKHSSVMNERLLTDDIPVDTYVVSSTADKSGSGSPCFFGLKPCVIPNNLNDVNLLWSDMRRTLALAWQLHVFGSAGLFILMVVLAVFGLFGAFTLPSPLHGDLILPNVLLIVSGSLRAAILLLDPYGTRQVLSHVTLAALHNIPMQLLMWTQISLPMITLRGLKLFPFPTKLMHPSVMGLLAISHTSLMVVIDVYPPVSFPELPLVLQGVSFCWSLLFCIGFLAKSLTYKTGQRRASSPQRIQAHRIVRRAKQVTMVCSFFGIICCCLQIFSLLWFHGLLGNWRRFGWSWWLCQFWARMLEISWGFSLLILGSWIFWSPISCHKKTNNEKDSRGGAKKEIPRNRILSVLRGLAFKKSKDTWKALIPNNFAKFKQSTPGDSDNIMSPYDIQPSDYKSSQVSDAEDTCLWPNLSDRECILSLIEFEMKPPSPINLQRSIDSALSPRHLIPGGLFTSPPLHRSRTLEPDPTGRETGNQAFTGYGWTVDTDSIATSLDHFVTERCLSSATENTFSAGTNDKQRVNSGYSEGTYQPEWSDDDVTDL